jgi:hypothetical protein
MRLFEINDQGGAPERASLVRRERNVTDSDPYLIAR